MKTRLMLKLFLIIGFFGLVAVGAQGAYLTTLYSFDGTNGANPRAGLIQGTNGNFYGLAYVGGTNNLGTIFEMTPAGILTNRWNFNRTDGALPASPFILGQDGNFYGEALGGTLGFGTVFKLTQDGTFSNLVSFVPPAGVSTSGPLLQGQDGNFYGVTEQAVTLGNSGTIYRMTPDGTVTNLYTFSGPDGFRPRGGLVQGTNGILYGTTSQGGTNGGYGTIFKISTNGTFQSMWSFNQTNGSNPGTAPLVFGPDGNLYGTTITGGTNENYGTIFRITPSGTFTSLVSLDGNTMGASVNAGLLLGTNGNFYGATYGGGGSIFEVTPNGTFTTLYVFDGSQGIGPLGTLVQGTDGNLYGTTQTGGAYDLGTVFRLSFTAPDAPVILSVSATNGTLDLTWSSVSGQNYQLQSNPDLTTTNWTDVNPPVTATDVTTSGTDTIGPEAQRFYRVELLP
ncbi:MAG: choice-of-anchor tandem repeat GloVer-containing protein [Limisphaerales bacterium]